ncbi:hydrolase [Arthrobacter sp. Hiyo8]|nr:hydrolase [Arthrobacter sp. Hiyo8]
MFKRFVSGLCDLDTAGLATATDLYLRLDDGYAADALGSSLCFFRSVRHDAGEHGYTVRFEHIARLIFKQVHGLVSFYVEVVSVQPETTVTAKTGCG